jgi:hypothetical protein
MCALQLPLSLDPTCSQEFSHGFTNGSSKSKGSTIVILWLGKCSFMAKNDT